MLDLTGNRGFSANPGLAIKAGDKLVFWPFVGKSQVKPLNGLAFLGKTTAAYKSGRNSVGALPGPEQAKGSSHV